MQTFADVNGGISYNCFLNQLINVPLTPRIRALVQKAWDATGRHGQKDATGNDIATAFSKPEMLNCFLDQFETTKNGNLEGVITRQEFETAF
jgi:hypothetical protein